MTYGKPAILSVLKDALALQEWRRQLETELFKFRHRRRFLPCSDPKCPICQPEEP